MYRKYAAFIIGPRILPRHLFFGEHWCVKAWERMDPELLEEERRYIEAFPHHEALQQIFDVAGVQFGRIDYGVVNGKIQGWEINTNPMLPVPYGGGGPRRQWIHERFREQFIEAFKSIDSTAPDAPVVKNTGAIGPWTAATMAGRYLARRVMRGQRKKVQ